MNKKLLFLLAAILTFGAVMPANAFRVYLKGDNTATDPKVYAWIGSNNELFGKWAEEDQQGMTKVTLGGETFYYKELGAHTSVNVIFKQGNTTWQTEDITNVTAETFYQLNGKNNNDGKYYTKPLSIPTLIAPTVTINEDNKVVITKSGDSGEVYYTTDGTEPTAESNHGDATLNKADVAIVKAIQIYENMVSEIVEVDCQEHIYAESEGEVVYFATEAEGDVQICATDEVYFPVANQPADSSTPEKLYIQGNIQGHAWDPSYEVAAIRYGNVFVFDKVTFDNGDYPVYFSFSTMLGSDKEDWDGLNSGDRFGAPEENTPIDADVFTNASKYRAGFGGNASSCKSWEIAAGTYRIVVDFTNGKDNVKMMYTEKARPEFVSMTAVSVENDNVGVDGKNLYRTALEGNFNVAFLQSENFINAGAVSEGTTYIYNNGDLKPTARVAANLELAEAPLYDGETLEFTYGTTAAQYNIADAAVTVEGTETTVDVSALEAHQRFILGWTATNAEGLSYYGSYELINSPADVEKITIKARVPQGWDGIKFAMVSNLNSKHTHAAEFTDIDGDYYVITVPRHMVHSKVTFSNTAAPAQGTMRREATQSYTYNLAGKSMYFENNGEHWGEEAFDNSTNGVANVAVDEAAPEYFNLQGVRVDNPGTGVYIVRRGANTYKTVIR